MNIVKLLVIIVLLYVGYKIVTMFQRGKSRTVQNHPGAAAPAEGEDLVQDPFCKTYVPKSQAYIRDIEGKNTYFCSRECCDKYLETKK